MRAPPVRRPIRRWVIPGSGTDAAVHSRARGVLLGRAGAAASCCSSSAATDVSSPAGGRTSSPPLVYLCTRLGHRSPGGSPCPRAPPTDATKPRAVLRTPGLLCGRGFSVEHTLPHSVVVARGAAHGRG